MLLAKWRGLLPAPGRQLVAIVSGIRLYVKIETGASITGKLASSAVGSAGVESVTPQQVLLS